jgi:serine kinase
MEGDKRHVICHQQQQQQQQQRCNSRKARPRSQLAVDSTNYKAYLAARGYIVKETLGSGSYSKVKLAEDLKRKCRVDSVAIKIVDTSRAPLDYQTKFMPRELDIWPQLMHPHLCRLYETFRDECRVYMVEEYAPRGDLLHHIQSRGAASEEQARHWMLQLLDAINYMHNCGLAHRDLKLENLLLDADWNIKICDFGFTKRINNRDLSQTYCGSKSYAAPEILKGQPYDPIKADVWAMGVILYIMVTAKMPFDESKPNRVLLEDMKAQGFKWFKYPKLSDDCKNAIHTMFKWDFMVRQSIHSLRANHPWFRIRSLRETSPDKRIKLEATV